MIKPLNSTQLSSARPRCGLQSISDLVPRLIRQYEIQAQLAQANLAERTQPNSPEPAKQTKVVRKRRLNPAAATLVVASIPAQQTTFGWE